MPMLIIGVLLLLAKVTDFGPTAGWSWWVVLAPFGLAVLWWHFADASGLTKRRAMQKMEERKQQRRENAMQALGLDHKRDKQVQSGRARARDGGCRAAAPPSRPEADPPRREPRM